MREGDWCSLTVVTCVTVCVCVCVQGAIALCEMVEFYGCASRIILSANSRLRPRAWLTVGRMLKKVYIIIYYSISA